MIFQKTYQQVLNGTKTQTRRPVKPGDKGLGFVHTLGDDEIVIVDNYGRTKWKRGNTYAVQPGRDKKAVGRIRITKIRRERLRDISAADCRAEGITSVLGRFAFEKLWDSLYRKPYRWQVNPEVWVLEFGKANKL